MGRKGSRYLNAGTFIVVANSIEVRPSPAARAMVRGEIELLLVLVVVFLCSPGVADLADIRGGWGVRSGWGCCRIEQKNKTVKRLSGYIEGYEGILEVVSVVERGGGMWIQYRDDARFIRMSLHRQVYGQLTDICSGCSAKVIPIPKEVINFREGN